MLANRSPLRNVLLAGALACAVSALAFSGCGGSDAKTDAAGGAGGGQAGGAGGGAGGGGAGGTGGAGGSGGAGGAGGSGGSSATGAGYAGCEGMFTDQSAMSAVEIKFGGGIGLKYDPKCLKVKKGTKVTWSGDFSFHPLKGASGNKNKEIPATSTGMTASVTFMNAGFHGYWCTMHGTDDGTKMAGNVQVVE